MRTFGLFLLRSVVGVVLISHGLPKLLPLWGGSPTDTAVLFNAVGLEPAYPLAVVTGIVEVFGGVLLIAGGYTVLITIVLTVTTLAIGWKLHFPNGFFLNWSLNSAAGHGYEYDLLLVGTFLCLLFSGPGAFSIDSWRAKVRESKELGRARLPAQNL